MEEEKELFVVQKCWFDGPKIEPAVDYRRLFVLRTEAELCAHRSADLYAAAAGGRVRTILLPRQHHQQQQQENSNGNNNVQRQGQASSYAFVAKGKLFWVRSVTAAVLPAAIVGEAKQNLIVAPRLPYAYGILTRGAVLGGTENPNSRRGTEIDRGRLFVSLNPTNARSAAERQQEILCGEVAPSFQSWEMARSLFAIVALPIGMPTLAPAGGDFSGRPEQQLSLLQSWPDYEQWPLQSQSGVFGDHHHKRLQPTVATERQPLVSSWRLDAAAGQENGTMNHQQQHFDPFCAGQPPFKKHHTMTNYSALSATTATAAAVTPTSSDIGGCSDTMMMEH